jgi:hypothetical protein
VLLPEAMVDELQEKAGFSDTSNHIDSIPVSPIMMNLNMYEKDILFDSRYNYKLSPTKYYLEQHFHGRNGDMVYFGKL